MDESLKIPDFLMEKVKSKLIANHIYINGIHVMEILNQNNRHRAVSLIYEQVAEEVTKMLNWFTGMVIQMIRFRDNSMSLEDLLNDIQLTVFNLNGCLKHLYDNGANVAQALDRYLFLSDIIFVYRAEYDIDTFTDTNTETPGLDFQNQKILDLIKKKTRITIGDEDVPQMSFFDLLADAKTIILNYTNFYNHCYECGWLYTDQLKWKSLIKSVTVQNLLSPISGKTLQQSYKDIAAEVDSTNVLAFYVEVAETLSMVLVKNSSDIIPLFVDYLRIMIVSGSRNNAIRHERLKAVNVVLDDQLKILNSFQRFMKSTLHLECPEPLLSKTAEALKSIVGCVFECLENHVLERDLLTIINLVTLFADHVHFSDTEGQFEIARTETETPEILEKIINDMRVASLATTEMGRVIIIEK
ncbi:uncharacterized protein LOC126839558 [Adelges cooleyi]|uniref:uncharacterized protein LOC126839558 n=1 Tax=Adelges cooleyi TaxID=133065 RepID=UPI002180077A|nr:uncharacterized protein LOC126839558 [Adelges cooleyi]